MPSQAKQKIVVIIGPTASGKSDLSIAIAQKFNAEIISADSRQVYRGMDIGTGKVTKHEQELVPHHLLDIADPKRNFSVARFQRLGAQAIRSILHRGKTPVIVGGTGFYIDALVYNMKLPNVKPNKNLRAKLEKQSAEHLFSQLQKLDSTRAASIDRHNKHRLIRALEIIYSTGKAVPAALTESPYDILWLGITWPKEMLEHRITTRLNTRFKQGMIDEVQRLHKQGVSWERLESFGLEYRWVAYYLQDRTTLAEMKQALKGSIIQYAKRQMTWFKRNKKIHWLETKGQALRLAREFVS